MVSTKFQVPNVFRLSARRCCLFLSFVLQKNRDAYSVAEMFFIFVMYASRFILIGSEPAITFSPKISLGYLSLAWIDVVSI